MSARIYIYLAQVIVWTLFQFFFFLFLVFFFFFFFQELASQYPQTTRGCRKASVATHTPSISFFPSRTSHTNSSTTNAAGAAGEAGAAAADAAAGRVLAGLSSRVDKKDYTAVAGSNH